MRITSINALVAGLRTADPKLLDNRYEIRSDFGRARGCKDARYVASRLEIGVAQAIDFVVI